MTSTFVNDLRLNEMATGDQSGSWGTVTNTNLELIGEALGYGTEGITTNADTHTSTIADGATDPVRALYVEYTGTLDSACTVTIAPNTVNKVCFIENGTSGSQNIIIKQGSGATITIPPGDTKAVYLDGAGSGAKVVDAFASLSVVDLKVQDDLTVTDDVAIGGTLAVTGIVSLADGTAGAPSLTNTGDVNAGLFFSAADTLAFSAGGTAQFTMADGVIAPVTDSDVDLGTDSLFFKDAHIDTITTTGVISAGGVVTANAGVVVDEMTLDADTLTATDDFIIDAAGEIALDSATGITQYKDGGTEFLRIAESSGDVVIQSIVQDKKIFFSGDDAGDFVNALVLNMANAGDATFNRSVILGDAKFILWGDGTVAIAGDGSAETLKFFTSNVEKARFDASGNFMVAHTSPFGPIADGGAGVSIMANGQIFCAHAGPPLFINRENSDGIVVVLRKDGATAGNIGIVGDTPFFANPSTGGIRLGTQSGTTVVVACSETGALEDNLHALGHANTRWKDAFITDGVTTGSDRNEKQDIAALTSSEMLVAARLSKTFHTYRWKDAVVDKGDNARIHTGTIAQEVQAAFTAESLDAGRYAMFMSDTWWEHYVDVAAVEADDTVDPAIEAKDAYTHTYHYDTEDEAPSGSTSRTRLGIRYPELLSFLAAYNEQRFASIETRLTALDNA